MTGLYVHVPFCAKKCHYCDFTVALSAGGALHGRYLKALRTEMRERAGLFASTVFDTLYLGGGTPSLLGGDWMRELMDALREHFRFADEAEITLEANPGDVTADKAALYRRLGFNRVSLGAQSFNDATLERLNRTHRAADIADSMKRLRAAGFDNISLDLMLALPGEALEDVERSLEAAAALEPEHFSLYELSVEPKTRFGALAEKGELDVPEEEAQLAMLETARTFLQDNGWRHYELLSYARPERESRHNSLYWSGEDYLGLGPGAFSYVDGTRSRVAATVDRYYHKMESGDLEPDETERLEGLHREHEAFVLALRLIEGAETGRFRSLLDHIGPDLASLQRDGLIETGEGRIRLTERGQLFAETVFSELSL